MSDQQESSPQVSASTSTENLKPVRIEPDVNFIRVLSKESSNTFKLCMQCGTCSVTCGVSPDRAPFPRKEMAWATWGLKDRLIGDPDIWLCHQCNDCSTRCPRGARPGDVLASIRQEVIAHYAVPRFLGRWVKNPKYIPLLLAIPAVLLGLAMLARDPIEKALGLSTRIDDRIVFPYSSVFPHWVLNSFFIFFSVLALLAAVGGVVRFWREMKAASARDRTIASGKNLGASFVAALKSAVIHENFTTCTTETSRFLPHFCVFFGFIALLVVTLWVITNAYNPLIQGPFVYPFSFWNPLKMLANLGGAVLLLGCVLMIFDRLTDEHAGSSTYSDWAFLGTILAVVATGFITELLHYARLVPHRHVAYFIHLVFVFSLIVYLPYSKFAHFIYRTAALAFVEFSGRNTARPPMPASETLKGDKGKGLEAAKSVA
jgi:quinone-modifying oxidoreductase, subunit QmoC